MSVFGAYAAPYVRDALLLMLQNSIKVGAIDIHLKNPNDYQKSKTVRVGSTNSADWEQLRASLVVNDEPTLWFKLCQNLDIVSYFIPTHGAHDLTDAN